MSAYTKPIRQVKLVTQTPFTLADGTVLGQWQSGGKTQPVKNNGSSQKPQLRESTYAEGLKLFRAQEGRPQLCAKSSNWGQAHTQSSNEWGHSLSFSFRIQGTVIDSCDSRCGALLHGKNQRPVWGRNVASNSKEWVQGKGDCNRPAWKQATANNQGLHFK